MLTDHCHVQGFMFPCFTEEIMMIRILSRFNFRASFVNHLFCIFLISCLVLLYFKAACHVFGVVSLLVHSVFSWLCVTLNNCKVSVILRNWRFINGGCVIHAKPFIYKKIHLYSLHVVLQPVPWRHSLSFFFLLVE